MFLFNPVTVVKPTYRLKLSADYLTDVLWRGYGLTNLDRGLYAYMDHKVSYDK